MKTFDKYFTYFIILSIIVVCGMFSYAAITDGFVVDSEIPNANDFISILFSFVGYMIGMMVTLGIILAYVTIFEFEKEDKKEDDDEELTKEEKKEKAEKRANVMGGAFMVSMFWPAVVVYMVFYFIFKYIKEKGWK